MAKKDAKHIPDLNGQDSWRIFRIMAEFVEGFEVMSPIGKAVSLFGSARTRPDDRYYKQAEETARLFAKAGFGVITGGGPGIMEAGNKGAYEAGGSARRRSARRPSGTGPWSRGRPGRDGPAARGR